MNPCRRISSLCNGLDVLPVQYLTRQPKLMCAGCRDAMTAAGAHFTIVERRVRVEPVTTERRRYVSRFVRGARDLSGWMRAA